MIDHKYSNFFKGLAENNHREWFQENKKVYENDVKKPFLALIEEIIPLLKQMDEHISPVAKDALFRINRDIRFSKDKTPYNTIMKASLAPGGKKSFLPGYYLGIDADHIHVGGGLLNLKSPELKQIRQLISETPEEFTEMVTKKSFVDKFGELKGESSKRIDAKYQEAIERAPFIVKKQFYAMTKIALKPYLGTDQLPALVLDYFREIYPLNQYLNQAFS